MPRSLAMDILSALATARRTRVHHDDGPSAERDFDVDEFDRLEVSGCLLFFCAGQTWARYDPETARGTVVAGAAGGHS